MPYENYEIKNIYQNKDGRFRIYLKSDKDFIVMSYPKFLMEMHLGRYLNYDETIDHIDKDFTNNDIKNLKVLERNIHCKKDALRNKPQKFICPECNKEFILEGRKLCDAKSNRKKHRAGPFCCKGCAGRYGQKVQMGMEPLNVELIKLEKFRLSGEKDLDKTAEELYNELVLE